MPDFRKLEDIFKHLEDNVIRDVMANEVHDVVADTMQYNAIQEVYRSYTPSMYERRGDEGGLADKRNIIGTFYNTVNGVEYLMQNITKGKDDDFYIAGLVEYGDGTSYGRYTYPRYNRDPNVYTYLQPRPFMYYTREYLRNNNDLRKAFQDGLRRFGIKTE